MIRLDIPGKVIPKARARVTRNGTFHPIAYQRWMRIAIASLQSQWGDRPTLNKVDKIEVKIFSIQARGDIDNLGAAVMDALVKSEVLKNDNLTVVAHVEFSWTRSPNNLAEIFIREY